MWGDERLDSTQSGHSRQFTKVAGIKTPPKKGLVRAVNRNYFGCTTKNLTTVFPTFLLPIRHVSHERDARVKSFLPRVCKSPQ